MVEGHEVFERDCLLAHNRYRARFGCPPLKLNPKLTKYANCWAKKLAEQNCLKHSKFRSFGENLFKSQHVSIDGQTPVHFWYQEIQHYNFMQGKFAKTTSNFTQLIWKSSRELGVGQASKGCTSFVVACYSPAGNVEGAFVQNVPSLLITQEENAKIGSSPQDQDQRSHKALKRSEPVADARMPTKPTKPKISSKQEQQNLDSRKGLRRTELLAASRMTKSQQNQAVEEALHSQAPKVFKRNLIPAEERNFQMECLEKHNELRKQHGVPPLAYSENLANIATSWARQLAASNQLTHSAKNEFGESVYMSEGIRVKGSTPVIAWYDEIEDYDFDRALFSANTGHFTQLVWKGTTHLGVGVAKNSSGATIVVTNYHPRGNVRGLFRENVPPLRMAISKEGKEPNSVLGPILAGIVLAAVCVVGAYYFLIL